MPTFDDFTTALRTPGLRPLLGLHIAGYDAALLLANPVWAQTYYRQWLGEPVTAEPGAPIAIPRAVVDEPAPLRPAAELPDEGLHPRRRLRRLAELALGAA